MATLIIDCDPGLDDALAIALAHASPELRVEAITTVAGNSTIETVTRNALGVIATLGADIPVHPGCAMPMLKAPVHSTALWGGDGVLPLDPAGRERAQAHAVARLEEALEAAPENGALICAIGPLTNIATLMVMRRDLVPRIRRLAIMGGAIERGNASPAAELNIWFDPHAAAIVFNSGAPMTIALLDLTRRLKAPPDAIASLSASDAPHAQLAARLLPLSGSNSHPSSIHDAAAIAWLLWPEIFAGHTGRVSVELGDGGEQGRTRFEPEQGGPHQILTDADLDLFFKRLVERLRGNRALDAG